ncbi:MAG: HlyD family secretion protein [Sulfurimonas sp.]|nr:MAG: HlyD family secretion protein [Sulfurimonas sp.]
MKLIMTLIVTLSVLCAKEYYAKVEPYEIKTISSNVSAVVLRADEAKEGTLLDGNDYIVLDDKLDTVELKKITRKMALLRQTIAYNQKMIQNYEALLEKKKRNFERIKNLKIKSSVEKDREFYDLVASQNQYLNTQKELANITIQLNDLQLREAVLKKSIRDKHLSNKGWMLYDLLVHQGAFVTPSTPLAQLADVSKAKLVIYLNRDEVEGALAKTLYINGIKSPYKITKIWRIADAKHLSSYKAEIVMDAPKVFSNLVKVELRDE